MRRNLGQRDPVLCHVAQPLPFFEHSSSRYVRPRKNYQDSTHQEALDAAYPYFEADDSPFNRIPHDLPDPYIELCFRGQDPLADPRFAHWAKAVYGSALDWFKLEGA